MSFWHDYYWIWDLHINLDNQSATTTIQLEDLTSIFQDVYPFQHVDDGFFWWLDPSG